MDQMMTMNNEIFNENSKELEEDMHALKSHFEDVKSVLQKRKLTQEEIEQLPEAERQVVEEQKAIEGLQEEFEKILSKTSNYKSIGFGSEFNTVGGQEEPEGDL